MTRKCIICRKKPSKVVSRTFHSFPKDEDLRIKWMLALNLDVAPNFKTAFVCSDHFNEESFCRANNNCIRRRLSPNAVPLNYVKSSCEESEMIKTGDSIKAENNIILEVSGLNNNKSEMIIKSEDTIEALHDISPQSYEENVDSSPCNKETDNQPIPNSKKRLRSPKRDNHSRKKIRFMNNFKTEYISRNDFVSDEAWTKFLRFNSCKNKNLNAAWSKTCRKKKKLLTLKETINCLKNIK